MKTAPLHALAALSAILLASPVLAQSLTGTVSGVVTDEQGGVLPGATITLLGKTGATSAVTSADGSYRFLGVEPGVFAVSVAMSGFEGKRRPAVAVTLGKNTAVDFALSVSSLSEVVDVTGEAPVVDVTSSSTSNSLSQDLLFSMPIRPTNAATQLLNYTPGINNGSAFGGDSDTGNALLLDGVDTRDPGFGSAWTFFNFNIIEEVQIGGLGSPAEYGGFTGGVVNTVTKSGGNRTAGLFEAQWTNSSLASDNLTSEITRLNPALAEPATTTKLLDFTGQLSGPIKQDKLFYFASIQRYQLDRDPTGPLKLRHEVSPRFNGKLSWLADANDRLDVTVQADDYNINGRCGVPALVCTDILTNDEDAPEILWLAQWRHTFGSSTFSEVKYTGWWGYFDLNPTVNKPGRFDGETGANLVSQGWYYYGDRIRNQANAAITHYADAFGKHELKFGIEVERSSARDRYGYVNDIFYYDYGGQPYLAYNYSYDIDGTNERVAAYAQDSWKITDRLSLNPGVRLDVFRGKAFTRDQSDNRIGGDTVYRTSGLAPRLGFAFDVTGDNKTVLKGFYGKYYEGLFTPLYSGAIPGRADFVLYDVTACPSVTAPCPANLREEIDRSPSPLYRIDPDIKHPRTDEFNLGFERALTGDVRLQVTGVWRDTKNVQGSVVPSARWSPTNVANGVTGGTLTVYNWTNRSASETDLLYTNPDGFQYRDATGNVLGTAAAERTYRSAIVVLNKRMSRSWLGQASYVWSQTEGTISNGGLNQYGVSRLFETPTLALVNSRGPSLNDRTHELKIMAGYQVPKVDVMVSTYYRYLSGRTYAPFQRFGSSSINFPFSAGRQPLLEPRGSRRLPSESTLDLRLEKVFTLANGGRIGLFADVSNVFNTTTILGRQTRYPNVSITGVDDPVAFDSPSAINAPRQIQLTARWSF